MADFTTLKAKVVAKLQEQTSWFESSAQVLQYEPEMATEIADPYAVVLASGNDNDFASTSENKRTYAFRIRLYMERKTRGASKAETDLQTLVDALIDAFDQDYTLGGTALISRAVPSAWGYILGEKEYRTAEIVIKAMTWFDVT